LCFGRKCRREIRAIELQAFLLAIEGQLTGPGAENLALMAMA
jgi:hypothetical protein